ncbi:MAG TPA: hypothetical protein VGJ05_11130 [Fimbriiglobus sp.]|jgi:hypothetical protein
MARCAGVLIFLVALASARAQQSQPTALRFAWKPGQTLSFVVNQTTTVAETLAGESEDKPTTSTTATKLTLTRTWTVKDVDAAGSATLDMAITAFRQETTRTASGTGGKPAPADVLDSANPADRAKLPFLGKTMVTTKVDARGQVADVKSEAGDAAAARLKAELPFRVVLPAEAVAVGAKWDRPFAVKLDPPQGTGETYEFTQSATFRGVNQGYAVIALTTALKAAPKSSGELLPLIPSLWEGDVFVNLQTGSYAGAKLTVKKEIPNHLGVGSKFVYTSEYTEAVAAGK